MKIEAHDPIPNKLYFKPKQLAQMLDVSPSTVRRWMDEGAVIHSHISRFIVRIPREEVVRIVRNGSPYPVRAERS